MTDALSNVAGACLAKLYGRPAEGVRDVSRAGQASLRCATSGIVSAIVRGSSSTALTLSPRVDTPWSTGWAARVLGPWRQPHARARGGAGDPLLTGLYEPAGHALSNVHVDIPFGPGASSSFRPGVRGGARPQADDRGDPGTRNRCALRASRNTGRNEGRGFGQPAGGVRIQGFTFRLPGGRGGLAGPPWSRSPGRHSAPQAKEGFLHGV